MGDTVVKIRRHANKSVCKEASGKCSTWLHYPSQLLNAEVYKVDSLLICHEFVHPPRHSFFPKHVNGVQKKGKFIEKKLS